LVEKQQFFILPSANLLDHLKTPLSFFLKF